MKKKTEKTSVSYDPVVISEATSIHDLIVDTLNTETLDFYDWVEVSSETFAADVATMINLVAQSQAAIDNKYYEKCPALIDELTAVIAAVNSGYSITTGIDNIYFNEKDAVIYDSRGRRVKKITSPGVYIINGNKVYIDNITK